MIRSALGRVHAGLLGRGDSVLAAVLAVAAYLSGYVAGIRDAGRVSVVGASPEDPETPEGPTDD